MILGQELKAPSGQVCPQGSWPLRTKGVLDVFIDTCPLRKCPFTSGQGAREGEAKLYWRKRHFQHLGTASVHPGLGAVGQHRSSGRPGWLPSSSAGRHMSHYSLHPEDGSVQPRPLSPVTTLEDLCRLPQVQVQVFPHPGLRVRVSVAAVATGTSSVLGSSWITHNQVTH